MFEAINEEFHQRRDAAGDAATPLARISAGIHVFLDLCTDDAFAGVALVDALRLIPGQRWRGTSYELLRAQLEEAEASGETRPCDVDAMAIALYGAVRSAGELVTGTPERDRRRAATTAAETLDILLYGLRARP